MTKKLARKHMRVDITDQQSAKLREEVFSNSRLNEVQRRKAVKLTLPLPADGSHVDLFCDGQFVGAV